MIFGKIWGQIELLLYQINGVLEFHRIEYKKNVVYVQNINMSLNGMGFL